MRINEQTLLNIYIPDEIDYVVVGGYSPYKHIFEKKETKSHKEKMKNVAKASAVKDVFLTSKNTIQTNYRIKSNGGTFIYDFMNHKIADINNQCLEYIFECCVIDKGTIINPCIWGIYNGKGFLIPANTELHEIAIKNTERRNKTTTVRELKPGNTIILKDGVQGKFYGKFLLHGERNAKIEDNETIAGKYGLLSDVPFFVYNVIKNGNATNEFVASKALKVSDITNSDVLDKEELRLNLNEKLYNDKMVLTVVSRDIYTTYVHYFSDITEKEVFDVSFEIKNFGDLTNILVSPDEVNEYFDMTRKHNAYDNVVFLDKDNNEAVSCYISECKKIISANSVSSYSGYSVDLNKFLTTGILSYKNNAYYRNSKTLDINKTSLLSLLVTVKIKDHPTLYFND